jgi:hypothetical protein
MTGVAFARPWPQQYKQFNKQNSSLPVLVFKSTTERHENEVHVGILKQCESTTQSKAEHLSEVKTPTKISIWDTNGLYCQFETIIKFPMLCSLAVVDLLDGGKIPGTNITAQHSPWCQHISTSSGRRSTSTNLFAQFHFFDIFRMFAIKEKIRQSITFS